MKIGYPGFINVRKQVFMGSNYKEILDQARIEKEKAVLQASLDENNPASIQAGNEETVNLCVRVPKSWRKAIKAKAVKYDVTLEKLVVDAINQYVTQQNWQ